MANNKNQHFVPKCYLREFSSCRDKRSINLFNIDRKMSIQSASLNGQCSKAYFYGEDQRLEDAIQNSERAYAETIRSIKRNVNFITQKDAVIMRHFCHLQQSRTEDTAMINVMHSQALSEFCSCGGIVEEKLSAKDAAILSLKLFSEYMNITRDLKVCIIKNRTNIPFITSDNPSVLCNKWHDSQPRGAVRSFGLRHSGVMFVLPITPFSVCIVYDGGVYNINNISGWSEIKKDSDAKAFNDLQFLNCAKNIYFYDWVDKDEIHKSFLEIESSRNCKFSATAAVLDMETETHQRYSVIPMKDIESVHETDVILHTRTLSPKPKRWPSIIKFRRDPKIYSNGRGSGYVRRWCIENGYCGDGEYYMVKNGHK